MFKIKLFRLLAILILGSNFLLIVFENLPFPFNNFLLYLILWFSALLLFNPSLFLSKKLFPVYTYAIIFLILSVFVWVDYNFGDKLRVIKEIVVIFTSITMMQYFIKSNDIKGLSIVIFAGVAFLVITAITSIFGLLKYPMAARDLAGVLGRDGELDLILKYNRMGIGGYGFFASLVFIFPVLVGLLKTVEIGNRSRNFIYFAISILFLSVIWSQYFANLLISSLGLMVALMGRKDIKKSFYIVVLFSLLILFIPQSFFYDFLRGVSSLFDGMLVQDRILDLVEYSQGGYTGQTEIDARAVRVPILFNQFITNPFFGAGVGNAHLHWLNKLSVFGLFGTVPLFFIIYSQVINNLLILSRQFAFYYLISVFSFLALGSLKSLLGNDILICIFFIVPGIYFLGLKLKLSFKLH